MDALIPQNILAGEVVVMGLCSLNLYISDTIDIRLRVGDGASELARVSSTWGNSRFKFSLRV
jgi:hypothetical protein